VSRELARYELDETYCKTHFNKHLSDSFPIQNGLRQGDALSLSLSNFAFDSLANQSKYFWFRNAGERFPGLSEIGKPRKERF
jgi:hypothetical protein